MNNLLKAVQKTNRLILNSTDSSNHKGHPVSASSPFAGRTVTSIQKLPRESDTNCSKNTVTNRAHIMHALYRKIKAESIEESNNILP